MTIDEMIIRDPISYFLQSLNESELESIKDLIAIEKRRRRLASYVNPFEAAIEEAIKHGQMDLFQPIYDAYRNRIRRPTFRVGKVQMSPYPDHLEVMSVENDTCEVAINFEWLRDPVGHQAKLDAIAQRKQAEKVETLLNSTNALEMALDQKRPELTALKGA